MRVAARDGSRARITKPFGDLQVAQDVYLPEVAGDGVMRIETAVQSQMPYASVTLRRSRSIRERRALVEVVESAMRAALRHPEKGCVRILELGPDDFSGPPNTSGDFALVEISLLKGRSQAAKRELYRLVFQGMEDLGIGPADVRVLLFELDPENVALCGGRAACDVDLGYALNV